MLGDATELYVLERAGIARPPDLVLAVTGDDEDNMVICQLAQEKYGVAEGDRARQRPAQPGALRPARDLADGLRDARASWRSSSTRCPSTTSSTCSSCARRTSRSSRCRSTRALPRAGKRVERLELPEGSRLISVMRDGHAEIAVGSTELQPGDQVLAILAAGQGGRAAAGPAQEADATSPGSCSCCSRPRCRGAALRPERLGRAAELRMRPFATRLRLAGLRDRAAQRAEQALRRRADRA